MILRTSLLALTSVPLLAQSSFPSNEDIRHYRTISHARVSPDARAVVFVITESTADVAAHHIWITTPDGTPRQLTFSPEKDKSGESEPEWTPDGSTIFFLAKRGEHTQLFKLSTQGGEAQPLSIKTLPPVDDSRTPNALPPTDATKPNTEKPEPLELDISAYSISPDGKSIAVLARDPQTPGEKKQEEAKADPKWIDHETHATRLYLYDLASSKLTPTSAPVDVSSVAWRSDSSEILAITEPPNNANDLGPANALSRVDAHTAQATAVSDFPKTINNAAFSRDGKHILFSAQSTEDAPPGYGELFDFDAATHTTRSLSQDFAGAVEGAGIVTEDDGGVLEPTNIGMRLVITRFRSGAKPQPLQLAGATIRELSTNERRTAWAYITSDATHPTQLYLTSTLASPGNPVPIPSLGPDRRSVPMQLVKWQNEGQTIEGMLFLPPDASPSHRVPLVLQVHGGPTGAYWEQYDPFAQMLVGAGYAVLMPNPRGSTGYGRAFAAANKNDLGGADFRDLMAGIDYTIAHHPIDPARLALFGYSYGGEMAGFAVGKTDRFKAIISGAPVTDQFSEYGTENGSWYDRWFYGKPWDHFADAWRQSPISTASHAKTPFLLLQGEADPTDPPGQSFEMYRALRQYGAPVEMVLYPRETHGTLAGGILGRPSKEPWHGFDARRRILDMLTKAFARP